MPAAVQQEADIEAELRSDIGAFFDDPLGFVLYAFPWGQGSLEGHDGPDDWQKDFLEELGREVSGRGFNGVSPVSPVQMATSSGHGIGKSALTSWLILWIMSTRPHCKGIVTANTSPQLETKTWAELAKWHKRAINQHWFKLSTGRGSMKIVQIDHPETWRCDAQTCSKENSEAFAGLHAADSTPFYIFDEASAVPEQIWEVAEGGKTDGEPMHFVFGNPTRNSGAFRQCFGRQKRQWITRQVDSRTARMTNKELIAKWAEVYGEDSDFFRVRVKGMFPRASSMQFIANDIVQRAMENKPAPHSSDELVIGVDVARFGDDDSVICIRRGSDAETHGFHRYHGLDGVQLANRVAEFIKKFNPDAVFVDTGGVGASCVDQLRRLQHDIIPVEFGSSPDRDMEAKVKNKRAEMWAVLREWLKMPGRSLPNDPQLEEELTAVEYGFNEKDEIVLERKEDMKKRGLASPDAADALALTFALPIEPRGAAEREEFGDDAPYDPFKLRRRAA